MSLKQRQGLTKRGVTLDRPVANDRALSPFQNLQRIWNFVWRTTQSLLCSPSGFWLVGGPLLALEAVLCILIIWKVPYTNIDWDAYMQEVAGFLAGERDYAKLEGDTGPLVYPAGFVYVYSALSFATSGGKNLRLAQCIFAGVYISTLAIVMAIYRRSSLGQRPYVLIFLTISKRLHSLYVLRLFNDPIAMLPMYLCVLAMLERKWGVATVLYSLALSIKMNILLFAPGFALLMYQALGLGQCIKNAQVAVLIQIAIAAPFLAVHPGSYLSRSFDFGRTFFYKWSTNWRFIDEQAFLMVPGYWWAISNRSKWTATKIGEDVASGAYLGRDVYL